jgi:Transglutaminase-like superfamily
VLRRFLSLERSDRWLVLEAVGLTAAVWIGVSVLRYAAVRRILDACTRIPGAAGGDEPRARAHRICWATSAVAARFAGATCLVQALTAETMMRRRGLVPVVRLGIRMRRSPTPLEAHAWLEYDGVVVLGAIEHLADFSPLGRPTP